MTAPTSPRAPVYYMGACEECGNDDPCQGYVLCSDCLEELYDDYYEEARQEH